MRIRVVGRTYARGISKHFRFSRLYLFCIILNVKFKNFLVCWSASLRSLNYLLHTSPPLTVHFSMTRSMRYQPILHTLYCTLHTEHAYCLRPRKQNSLFLRPARTTKLLPSCFFFYHMMTSDHRFFMVDSCIFQR